MHKMTPSAEYQGGLRTGRAICPWSPTSGQMRPGRQIQQDGGNNPPPGAGRGLSRSNARSRADGPRSRPSPGRARGTRHRAPCFLRVSARSSGREAIDEGERAILSEKRKTLLVLNGAGLLIASALTGWLYFFSLLGEIDLWPVINHVPIDIGGEQRAWNMAHLEGITNGLMLIGFAAAAPFIRLGPRQQS